MDFSPIIGMLFQIPDIVIMRKQNTSIRNCSSFTYKNIFRMNSVYRDFTNPNYAFLYRNPQPSIYFGSKKT